MDFFRVCRIVSALRHRGYLDWQVHITVTLPNQTKTFPGVSVRPSHGQSLKQNQLHKQRFATMQLQARLAKADLVDDLSEEPVLNPEAAEPAELEDYGDSEVSLQGMKAETSFDREWLLNLPLLSQLPWKVRPLVRFRLDERLEPHVLDGSDRDGNLRYLVTCAIAEHVRRTNIEITHRDDWCQLPAIKGDKGLLELVPEGPERNRLAAALAKVGSDLKGFAIMLPNGDVITPQTLMNAASEGKSATRAAVLRLSSQRPTMIANEPWTSSDWRKFDDTQRKKGVSSKLVGTSE